MLMPVYFIAEIENINDPKAYFKYVAEVPKIIEKFGGRYLARGNKHLTIFGDWKPGKIVIIEFDSLEQLRNSFGSPEYRAIAPLREKATRGRAIAVQGIG